MRRNAYYQDKAKALRSDMTNGEKLLWSRLRAHRMDGRKFRRQHVIGTYIVDFVCLQSRLIIEVDGDRHGDDQREALDAERDVYLAKSGFRVLRFGNHNVMTNLSGVAEEILEELGADGDLAGAPLPNPLSQRGQGGWLRVASAPEPPGDIGSQDHDRGDSPQHVAVGDPLDCDRHQEGGQDPDKRQIRERAPLL